MIAIRHLAKSRRSATLFAAVALIFAACAAHASAATVFNIYNGLKQANGEVGGSGTPNFVVGSIAVDQSTGDLYVTNLVLNQIEVFAPGKVKLPSITGAATPAGSFSFASPSSIAVDETAGPTNGDLFVADSGHNVVDILTTGGAFVGQLTGADTPAGSFSKPSGIAFDSEGNLYIADRGHGVIDKFAVGSEPVSDADYLSRFSAPQITSLGSIAIDPSDNLYVSNYHENFVKFDSSGNYLGTIGPYGDTTEVRVDPADEWLLFGVGGRTYVTELSGQPVWPATIPTAPVLIEPGYPEIVVEGVADEYKNVILYEGKTSLYSRGGGVTALIPTFHLPTVSGVTLTNIKGNTAEASGVVNPAGGGPTRCQFEVYTAVGSDGEPYQQKIAPCEPHGAYDGSSNQTVTGELTELEPGTKYSVRLAASNEAGYNPGPSTSITTPIAVHEVKTEAATNLTGAAAKLNGSFEGNGEDTHYYFEWGQSPPTDVSFPPPVHYGSFSPPRPGAVVSAASGTVHVSTNLENLEPATTYHFRLIAVNSVGQTTASDQEFTTLPAGPSVEVLAGRVHSDSAELQARIDPRGAETTYNLEYGSGDCATSSCESLSSGVTEGGTGFKEITLRVQHLAPSTTYHFRLVAQNFYTSKFGNGGTGDAQFVEPKGIAVDSKGNVWVADTGNNRVQEFAAGGYVRQFGGNGSGPGQLSGPNALATDSEGNVWVADAGNDRVQEFNSKGEFKLQFGATGTGNGQFTSMHAIAVNPTSGNIYVAAASRIQEFNSKGEYQRQWGGSGTGNGQFSELKGIAIDPEGHVWTIEAGLAGSYKPRIQEFSSEGAYTTKFEFTEGRENGQLSSPQALAIDSKGNLWVTDTSDNRIEEFNSKGEYVRQIGTQGGENFGNGQFRSPYGIATDSSGNVWVTETEGDRVQEFFSEGRTATTPDQTFTTFPLLNLESDPCPNAQVRKQTGAAQLMDCRAYELVSAASAGGYDVESDLAPGQTPYEGYPSASEPPRVLYTVHNGTIPGTGTPTNFTQDPYVATRTSEGWQTEYVGFPAAGLIANKGPFGSPLAEADSGLDSFAFGGAGLCSPCFPDGSTGVPLRLPDGSLVQGMAGSLDPGPSAAPAGEVRKRFSADGSHFVFGSTAQFEPDGNHNNGSVSIYERDLKAGTTHVVSKTPAGATMTGPGISELDISSGGTRVVIGQQVGTDAKGNRLYHLYMNVGDSAQTIDLTPGATSGVLYDGMSSDGTKVYFTATDKLTPDDHDTSADIYRANVTPSGATLTRISTGSGGTGDTNSCGAVSNWNGGDCNAVAIAGAAGVAVGDGSLYFLSPEKLDTSGSTQPVENAPNLYLARPGSAPQFIATLATTDPLVTDALSQAATRGWGGFQVAPSGDFAAFTSTRPLTGFDNNGFAEVFRYDAASRNLDCVSCAPTNVIPTSDATLPSHGLGLTDDGRVFFTSGEALAPGDANAGKKNAYEWENGTIDLISTGISPFDSGLFSVSPDGTDVYFFTRETLVGTDHNGDLLKLYDARHLGGFLLNPPKVPCQASDECHGPSSPVPPPPDIGTYEGTGGNVPTEKPRCRPGKVERKGHCVVRHPHRRHRHRAGRAGGHRHG